MQKPATTIWHVDTPDPAAILRKGPGCDREAAKAIARQLHPDNDVVAIEMGSLATDAYPRVTNLSIGCYPGLTVVCSPRLALPQLSRVDEGRVRLPASEHTYLIGLNPELGWGGFAHWHKGELRRSFSATRVNILEDTGLPMIWERPFWAGEYPIAPATGQRPDPQRLPFDPLRFADEANRRWLGFRYGCDDDASDKPTIEPKTLPLCSFATYPQGQAPQRTPQPQSRRHSRPPLRKWLRRITAGT